ncbi:hypothetical protein NP493_294g02002 [Ridgeia piscesae]|uniref:Uncharacterized protein n=1 Tax=Ridgeia piscesae TaxID=27915 RepID=A0AAD9UBU9_RIDPI|nr:hypothetical protein NP493_294g02002 [Ridgeia piscesae]
MPRGGTYASCGDCRRYFVCEGYSQTLHHCPRKPNWGFNADTKKCQYKSPHCFVCGDPCRNSPCAHGGTCSVVDQDYECACAPGWSGMECQFSTALCQPNPCKNGGKCTVRGDFDEIYYYKPAVSCDCSIGYHGEFCQDCVGKFKVTRNRGFVTGLSYSMSAEETLADCQRLCLLDYMFCAAVDYKEGLCSMIDNDEYHTDKLIEHVGNVHSVLKPCDSL